MLARIAALATGRVTWVDDDGVAEHEVLSWRDRWTLFGPHSWDWGWVRRYGEQPCGCTINPLTRRRVLIRWGCPSHSSFGPVRCTDE